MFTFIRKYPLRVIFLFSFFIYFISGSLVSSLGNNIVFSRYDLLFDTDVRERIRMLFYLLPVDLDRHPFVFLLHPILKTLSYLFFDFIFTPVIIQVIIAGIGNCLIYLILKKICFNEVTSYLLTLIYALSFSTLFFASIPELYIYSSCCGLFLVYYILCVKDGQITNNISLGFQELFVISFLFTLGVGINIINLLIWSPFIFYFISIAKNRKKIAFQLIFMIVFLFLFYSLLLNFLVYSDDLKLYFDKGISYFRFYLSWDRLCHVLQETFIAPFYSLPTLINKTLQEMVFFHFNNTLYFIPVVFLFGIPFLFRRQPIKNKGFFYVLLLIVIVHAVCNYFYNKTWFLYSQNYLFSMIILVAFLYNGIPLFVQKTVLSSFLLVQLVVNLKQMIIIYNWLNVMTLKLYVWLLILLIVFSILWYLIFKYGVFLSNNWKKYTIFKKYSFFLILYFLYTTCWFLLSSVTG